MLGCAPFLPFVFRLSGVRHFWKIMQIRRNGGLIFLFRTTNPKFVKFRVILENSSNSNKSYFYGKKSKSNEMSLKCVTVSILYHRTYRCRICKLGMSSGEEDLLLREVRLGLHIFDIISKGRQLKVDERRRGGSIQRTCIKIRQKSAITNMW